MASIARIFAPAARRPRRRCRNRFALPLVNPTFVNAKGVHNMATLNAGGVRNVAFVGPHHSGKTTLVEALLAHSNAIVRKGAVTDGTATTNHDAESINHQMSVAPGFAHLRTGDVRVNIIDCPGAVDF